MYVRVWVIPPPFRVVLGGVSAPFEPEALAPTFAETLADPDTAADPLAELVELTEPAAQAATPSRVGFPCPW